MKWVSVSTMKKSNSHLELKLLLSSANVLFRLGDMVAKIANKFETMIKSSDYLLCVPFVRQPFDFQELNASHHNGCTLTHVLSNFAKQGTVG